MFSVQAELCDVSQAAPVLFLETAFGGRVKERRQVGMGAGGCGSSAARVEVHVLDYIWTVQRAAVVAGIRTNLIPRPLHCRLGVVRSNSCRWLAMRGRASTIHMFVAASHHSRSASVIKVFIEFSRAEQFVSCACLYANQTSACVARRLPRD